MQVKQLVGLFWQVTHGEVQVLAIVVFVFVS